MTVTLLTSPGAGAVAVLEFRGPRARTEVEELCPQVARAPLGALRRARLELAGELLDDVLVWIAGAERIEVHLHGSQALVGRVLANFADSSVAAPNSDSLECAAERLLASASSESAARLLLDQVEGALRRELELVVASTRDVALDRLRRLVASGEIAARCINPPRVALVGPVNAGKSTLFNALVGARRAIVSASPGATRDVLCAPARLGEWPIEVLDTAGERELDAEGASAALELAGQELGRRAQAQADWIVRLWPGDGPLPPKQGESLRRREAWIESRADLATSPLAGCAARVSAAGDPHGAVETLARLYRREFSLPESPWSAPTPAPFDARSRDAVRGALAAAERDDSRDWRRSLRALLDG